VFYEQRIKVVGIKQEKIFVLSESFFSKLSSTLFVLNAKIVFFWVISDKNDVL